MKISHRSEESFGLIVYTIINDEIKFLIVKMNDKISTGDWTFSKGHSNLYDESDIHTAIRELNEETSLELDDLTVDIGKFATIKYSYQEEDISVHKRVKYYLAFCKPSVLEKAQPDRAEIEEIRWLNYQEAFAILTHETDKSNLTLFYNIITNKNPLILFDFDKVLSYSDFWGKLKQYNSNEWQRIVSYLFIDHRATLQNRWLRGKYQTEDVLWDLAHKLGYNYRNFQKTFDYEISNIRLDDRLIKKIAELKTKYRLAILTNNYDYFEEAIVEQNQKDFSYFDGIYSSASLKLMKTDKNGMAFKKIAKFFNTEIKDIIFIDDTEYNCQCFKSIGGIKVFSPKNVEETLEFLSTLD